RNDFAVRMNASKATNQGDIMMKTSKRIRTAAMLALLGLALANHARAVELRDSGRKYDNASERFVVLADFNNEAVLDRETQLVWQRSPLSATKWVFALHNCQSWG